MKHEVTGFASGAGIGLKSVVYHMKLQALPSAGLPCYCLDSLDSLDCPQLPLDWISF